MFRFVYRQCFMHILCWARRAHWPVFGWQHIGTRSFQRHRYLKQALKAVLKQLCSHRWCLWCFCQDFDMFIVAFCLVQALGSYFFSGSGSGAVRIFQNPVSSEIGHWSQKVLTISDFYPQFWVGALNVRWLISGRWNLLYVHLVTCCLVWFGSTLVRPSTCSMTAMLPLSRSRWHSGLVPSICRKKFARLPLLPLLCQKTSTSLILSSRQCREFW